MTATTVIQNQFKIIKARMLKLAEDIKNLEDMLF